MKLRVLLLSLCLGGCASSPPEQNADALIYNRYREGHLQMLAVHAPWMSEAQRQAHADAQTNEVLKSIRLQRQTGQIVPPVIIPLGEAPAPPTAAAENLSPPASTQPAASALIVPDRAPAPAVAPAGPAAHVRQASISVPPRPAVDPAQERQVVRDKAFVAGTFVMDGGAYSARVEAKGADLLVVEPNRSSLYRRQTDGSYQFHNPNTGSTFSLRVEDERTLLFDRVPSSGSPSRLIRETAPATRPDSELDLEIAERYRQRALSEPQDAQLWTMCSAAAFKRSVSDGQDNARYARQMAANIRQLMISSNNPCPDAISPEHW